MKYTHNIKSLFKHAANICSIRKKKRPSYTEATCISRHPIKKNELDQDAIEIINELSNAGYEAYLVGGCVRDAIMGRQPKDFDVATNAAPDAIKKVFGRRCRIIGRRFKLAHIRAGRKIIEVATFRAPPPQSSDEVSTLQHDNHYGSMKDDALRRDFTINALYYDPTNNLVIDFCEGYGDLNNQTLKLIGDPTKRYVEDPVRIIRAIRFKASLNVSLEEHTQRAIQPSAHLLARVPASRLFDELLKLFHFGFAYPAWQCLEEHQLANALFAGLEPLRTTDVNAMIEAAMKNTDERIAIGKSVTPAFLFAVMLWPVVKITWETRQQQYQIAPAPALDQAAQQVLSEQQKITSIPKRFTMAIRDIWFLQYLLTRQDIRRAERTLEHPRFRAGYDFLLLREIANEVPQKLTQWWTEYQFQPLAARKAMAHGKNNKRNQARQSRRRTKRNHQEADPNEDI